MEFYGSFLGESETIKKHMSALHNNDIAITLILCKSVKKWAMSTRLKRNAELKQNISGLVEGNTKPDNSPEKRSYWKLAMDRETIKCSHHGTNLVRFPFASGSWGTWQTPTLQEYPAVTSFIRIIVESFLHCIVHEQWAHDNWLSQDYHILHQNIEPNLQEPEQPSLEQTDSWNVQSKASHIVLDDNDIY